MLPVPPSIMVVPAPRAIVVLWELWPSTNGAHRVVTNPIPNIDATDRSPEPLKNIPLAMSSSYSLAVASAVENSLRRAVSMDPCATRGTRCDSTQMEGARPGTDHGAAPSDGTALQHVRRSSVLKGRARISPTAVRRSKLGLMGGLGIFVCQRSVVLDMHGHGEQISYALVLHFIYRLSLMLSTTTLGILGRLRVARCC